MSSDTPRADAHNWNEGHYDDPLHSLLDFAKQLERELNAANERIELLESCNADVARIAGERNDALKRIKRLEEAGDAMVLYATTPTKTAWKQAKEAKL